MALFFYGKPDFINKEHGPISYGSCYSYAEKAAASKTRIPDRLSFDNIIEGTTLPVRHILLQLYSVRLDNAALFIDGLHGLSRLCFA